MPPAFRKRPRVAHARRLQHFRRHLLRWYATHQRPLPWRRTRDPYAILVSEIMLQQTQVDRVIPKYHEFLRKYPTTRALATANPREVRKTWYPLGYNIRPARLQEIAREAVTKYGGAIPNRHEDLMAMDGVGRYTAGAVLSFAFRKDAPILDTNVRRVLRRVFGVHGDPMRAPAQQRLWDLAAAVIPKGKGYVFNQALMDFGATLCTARKPACLVCPMQLVCTAYPDGRVDDHG
ncbi:MAG: A/G-specific adenine glycosylase [Candidatus Omnitrophica bacterium]|nr:A/G-specific adenine glycosylase [Candidatus Omnitrophota bacterium]